MTPPCQRSAAQDTRERIGVSVQVQWNKPNSKLLAYMYAAVAIKQRIQTVQSSRHRLW